MTFILLIRSFDENKTTWWIMFLVFIITSLKMMTVRSFKCGRYMKNR